MDTFCNYNDQTLFFNALTFTRFLLRFKYPPLDLANVNPWTTMFAPYIIVFVRVQTKTLPTLDRYFPLISSNCIDSSSIVADVLKS